MTVPDAFAAAIIDNVSDGAFAPRVLVVRDSFLSLLPDEPEWARDGGIDAIAASFGHTTFMHRKIHVCRSAAPATDRLPLVAAGP